MPGADQLRVFEMEVAPQAAGRLGARQQTGFAPDFGGPEVKAPAMH